MNEELHAKYGRFGKRFNKALKIISEKGVKLHRFLPSGREIWTVVGNEGDQLVDDSQPYCSCRDFYYRVVDKENEICYHLMALKIAKKNNEFEKIEFMDEEYPYLLKSILEDIRNF